MSRTSALTRGASAPPAASRQRGYLVQIWFGLVSLFSGLWITLKNLASKPVTLTYPHKKPELSPTFRSAIDLIRFDETGTHDCVACMQCVQICPSFCISIKGERPDGLKRKRATEFLVDYALCSVCGLCIDVCPTITLKYSKIYDEVGYRRDGFVYDLLDGFSEGEAAYLDRARVEEAAKAAAKKAAAAEKAAAKLAAAATAANVAESEPPPTTTSEPETGSGGTG